MNRRSPNRSSQNGRVAGTGERPFFVVARNLTPTQAALPAAGAVAGWGRVAEGGLAECQVQWPEVPIVFCETRQLAQEWTFRFSVLRAPPWTPNPRHGRDSSSCRDSSGKSGPSRPAQIRAWARERGLAVSDRGRVWSRSSARTKDAEGQR